MPIDNRDLPVGTRLTAKYKGQQYVCVVEAAEGGEGVVYALQDGKTHKSPSSAGMEVMGGKAVNGWRFWTVEGEAPAAAEAPAAPAKAAKGDKAKTTAKTAKAKAPAKAKKLIYKVPNQNGQAQGTTRWFCTACMAAFTALGDEQPQVCPEGHRNDDTELNSAPAPEAVATDKAEEAAE